MLAYRILFLLVLLPAAWTQNEPLEQLDFRDVGGYMRRLARANTAEAKAIRKQIANGPRDLARERRAARREHIPVTPKELQAKPPPTAQNAAPDYLQLRDLLKKRPLDKRADEIASRTGIRADLAPEEIDAVKKMLAERRDVMNLIHQATGKPRCVFRRDWALGALMPFPEFATMREAARLLKAESFLLAKEGRYREAITNQAHGFRLAEHAASDPMLIAYLVGIAIDAITLRGMEDILILAGPNAQVAEQVRQTLATRHPHLSLRHALEGEVAINAVYMKMLRKGKPQDLENFQSGFGAARPGPAPRKFTPEERRFVNNLIDAAEASMVHDMRRQISFLNKPYPERQALYKRLEATQPAKDNPVNIFRDILFPVFSQATAVEPRSRAREEVVMAGAALLAYRARHGAFPDRLEQALPNPPRDPFTGRPLKYRHEGSGFVVYSVGESGKFDGGRPGMKREGREAYFRYP